MKTNVSIMIVALLCFMLVFNESTSASTINIPADYPHIQDGIDAANDGDTILVNPGIYLENINIMKDHIVLGSLFIVTGDESYIDETIIDGDSLGTVIRMGAYLNGADDVVIAGFTIKNGNGGGIKCIGSCEISNNIIRNNRSRKAGGIYIYGNGLIINNLITKNHAGDVGGGIVSYGGSSIIRNNIISRNISDHTTGGVHIEDSYYVTVESNIIIGNTSGGNGGGLIFYTDNTHCIVNNNLIAKNSSSENAAMSFAYGDYYMANNTIADNSGSECGMRICGFGTTVEMVNNILWNNGGTEVYAGDGTQTLFSYCDIRGGYYGEENINLNPMFCDVENNDYNLMEESPCIGTGYEESNMGACPVGCENMDIADDPEGLPTVSSLHQNYPNPFNATTKIEFSLDQSLYVNLEIYNILGERISTPVNNYLEKGNHSIILLSTNLPTGVYFYKLRAGEYSQTRRMLLLK